MFLHQSGYCYNEKYFHSVEKDKYKIFKDVTLYNTQIKARVFAQLLDVVIHIKELQKKVKKVN